MRAWQIRDGGRGVVIPFALDFNNAPVPITVEGQIATLHFAGWRYLNGGFGTLGAPWLWVFDSTYYTPNGSSPLTDSMVANGVDEGGRFTDRSFYQVTSVCESSFVGSTTSTAFNLIKDLLFGSVDGSFGNYGNRGATEAAWLPYAQPEVFSDLVDLASLRALLQGREDVLPSSAGSDIEGAQNLRVLPYDAASVKTVGDVLGLILKRLGGFMVYDRGKLRFGSWAVNNPIPTVVDDEALAEPAISLDFDRTACLQTVEVEVGVYRWRNDSGSEARSTIKRPVTNLDLGAAGLGKTTQMGTFTAWNEGATVVNNFILGSSWFANANQAIVRYSQPAAKVVVTYRDAVADLVVGETVAFSTAYLPSATGEMGVALATGIVLKAARSWKTPTTEYNLLLFGYVGASASKVPLIGASARCVGGVVGDTIPVEPVWFTRGTSATGGAPTSDVEAFEQTRILAGTARVRVILLDANGTQVAGSGTEQAEPDVALSKFRFLGPPFVGTTILAGYVITLDNSTHGLQGWDASQAASDGTISGDADNAFPWVT
jgi:hypothetical protein